MASGSVPWLQENPDLRFNPKEEDQARNDTSSPWKGTTCLISQFLCLSAIATFDDLTWEKS